MIGDGGKDRVRAYNCQAKKGREFKIGIGTKTVFFVLLQRFRFRMMLGLHYLLIS